MITKVYIFLFLLLLHGFSNFTQAKFSVEQVDKYVSQSLFPDFHKAMSNCSKYIEHNAESDPYWLAIKRLYDTYAIQDLEYSDAPRIPKIIHQIWLGSPFPEKYVHFQNTWKEHHPDWEYRLWTEKEVEEFGLINKVAYDESTNYGQKSDIVRYEILYRIGGLYVDTDFECFKSFDIFHHCFDFYTGVGCEKAFLAYMGLIGSAPGNKILKKCIDTISIYAMPKIYSHYSLNPMATILYTTGPFFFTECIKELLGNSDLGRSVVLPVNYFYPWPYFVSEKVYERTKLWIRPETFAMHHWYASWSDGMSLK